MKENLVKRILREGGLALGTHVGGIADPQIVELIGLAGFDAALIDMEHTSFDLHDVQLAVMAADHVGSRRSCARRGSIRPSSSGCWISASRASGCRMLVTLQRACRGQGATLPSARQARHGGGQPSRRFRQDPVDRAYGAVQS